MQHADNPVDWYPWGEEALDRARVENKPILLSIGYSACHWCHVIAHEWNRVGAQVDEFEDGLIIHGGKKLCGAEVDPHDDHRLAMSLAVVGLKVPGIRVRNKWCVVKSFPQFWEMWDSMISSAP